MNAHSTATRVMTGVDDVSSASARVHSPAWLRVVLRRLPPGMKMSEFYLRMGWPETVAYQKRRSTGDLSLALAAQMALATDSALGPFLAELASEQGVPPLFERMFQRPDLHRQHLKKLRGKQRRCSRCGDYGHEKDSPKCKGQAPPSEKLAMMRARASASPIRRRVRRKKKGRNA